MRYFSIKEGILYLLAIVIAFSTFSGFFNLGSTFYIGTCLAFVVISYLTRSTKLSIGSWGILGFILVCVFSIIINNPPSYFHTWERLLLFFNTLIAFSSLVVSSYLNNLRASLYDKLLRIMMAFSMASFIGFFFGINFFVRNDYVLAYNEAGHFSGFTNHSMVLAPISAMGGIYALTKVLTGPKNEFKRLRWIAAMLLCFGSVLLSASRGALAGSLFGIVVVIYKHNSGRMGSFFKYMLIGIAILAITFPFWGGLTQYVIEKNDYNVEHGGVTYSREIKMEARFYEIRNNFLTGVGFCVVDESVDYVDHSSGTIEPNSSWLAVFSMTGVFGFLLFLGIFIHTFYLAYKKIKDDSQAYLLCGILGFFFVHMIIEGYIMAAGSFLCGMYWLTIGVVHANVLKKQQIELR